MPDGANKYFPNYYVIVLSYYAKMLTALQAWIFALRYWLSATVIQMTKQWVTVEKIKVVGWVVGLAYLAIETIGLLMKLILFPGYYDVNWKNFKDSSFDTLSIWQSNFYTGLTILSSLLTIYAIFIIFLTSKLLSVNNSSINLKMRSMVLHSVLLIVQSSFTIYYAVVHKKLLQGEKAFVAEPIVDLFV